MGCDVVSGDEETMRLGTVTGFGSSSGLVQVLVRPGLALGLCACLCWRPAKGQRSQAGSISDGSKR